MFFNVQDKRNQINLLVIEQVEFNFIYARLRLYKDQLAPLILNSELNTLSFYSIGIVILKNVEIKDATFENSVGFFYLLAKNTYLSNFTAVNIGY